jgi:uncharacterized circularly permuted ATP-grasp superfamily protein/uncharacterized alpha-E superfamily protein
MQAPDTAYDRFVSQYRAGAGGYDEMTQADGLIRPHWRGLTRSLAAMGPDYLPQCWQESRRLLLEHGVTYNVYGDPQGAARLWDLDPIPLLVTGAEWTQLEAGLTQRARLFERILQDLYGPRELLRHGLLPPELIYADPAFLRACAGLAVQRLGLYAADLARGPDGRYWVMSDRTQAPSGAGYALANRLVMTAVLPSPFRDARVQPLSGFFQALRDHLVSLHPHGSDREARVVVLTPGLLNETYFEHAYLAEHLGFSLATGHDLIVRENRVWLRTAPTPEPVDVLLRRVDDGYCDPLELRPESLIGIPGLTEAVRQGQVTVVNPLGSGILENPGLLAFLPNIARHCLSEDLILPSVATWWCGQRAACDYVLAHLDRLVIKSVSRVLRQRPVFGKWLSRADLAEWRERIRARPHAYAAQEELVCADTPTVTDGGMEGRPTLLRVFLAAHGEGYTALPGGLTRVGGASDTTFISNQAGGFSKDTWVLAASAHAESPLESPYASLAASRRVSLARAAADNLYWLGRYLERTEHSLRVLRTALEAHRVATEFGNPSDLVCLARLLPALAAVTDTVITNGSGDQALPAVLGQAFQTNRSGSIAHAADCAVQAAYGAREWIVNDAWRVLTQIRESVQGLAHAAPTSPAECEPALHALMIALAAMQGLHSESMLREPAWLFFDLGRRLERGLLLADLLRNTLIHPIEPSAESSVLKAVLRAAESLSAFRRCYRTLPQFRTVSELLLRDAGHPRSLLYQVARVREYLHILPAYGQTERVPRHVQLALDSVAALETVELHAALPGTRLALQHLLTATDERLCACSDAITERYLSAVDAPRQLVINIPGVRDAIPDHA